MSTSTSYLCFGCVEIANNARTVAYHRWACRTGRYAGNCVPRLNWLCWCDDDGVPGDYIDPITDEACWYDPLIPESADFLGIIITKASGIRTSSFTREVLDGIAGGSILQRPLIKGRQIVYEAIVLATSCAGMDYGIEFMRRQLEDDGSCPQDLICTSCEGSQMTVRVHCDATDTALDDGLHQFTSAGTIDGFSIIEDDFPMGQACCCIMRRFTFTIATEDAASHATVATDSCSIDACSDDAFSYLTTCPVTAPDECCPFCFDASCDFCTVDPGCDCFPTTVLQPTTLAANQCFCEPVCRIVGACEIAQVQSGYETAVRVTLFAGVNPLDPVFQKFGMRNAVVRIWENPNGIIPPVDPAGYDVLAAGATLCAEVGITWMPAGSELVIDGVSGRVWLKCQGRCVDHSSRVFPISGSIFPLVTRCVPLVATVEWDPMNYAGDCTSPTVFPSSMTMESFLRFRL